MNESYDFTAEIARGMKKLDHYMPGWESRIDLDKLKLWSFRWCVLGQLAAQNYPGKHSIARFDHLANRLGVGGRLAIFGFDTSPFTSHSPFRRAGRRAFKALRDQWREAITTRLMKDLDAKFTEVSVQRDFALVR